MHRRRVAIMLDLQWFNRHHAEAFRGVMEFAHAAAWDCIVDEFVQEQLPRRRGKRPPYDGIIGRVSPELAARAEMCGVPLVNVWRNSPTDYPVSVYPDVAAAGRLVAQHLLDRGFRRFACLSDKRDQSDAEMAAAFHAVLGEHGYRCCCAHFARNQSRNVQTWQRFQETLARWMDQWQPPIGVLSCQIGPASRYLANACLRRGYRIPEDIAIASGCDEQTVCSQPEPTITSVDERYDRVGYEAAALLARLMNGEPPPREPQLVAPGGIIARQSTDFLVVSDDLVTVALRSIAERAHESITVDDVAKSVHTSRRNLERRFRAATGSSVFAEIRRLRIQRAQRMLLDSEQPIKQIAAACGFSSGSQMTHVFCQFVGMPPGEYRDQAVAKVSGTVSMGLESI